MYKKVRVLGIILSLTLIFTGCASNRVDEEEAAEQLVNQVFECLNNEDSEGLKILFSSDISRTHDLDKEIKCLFDFFEGKIVSYDDFNSGSGREKIEDGKQMLLTISPVVRNVVTDEGNTYEIRFLAYLICEEDENLVGIDGLKIIAEDDTICLVGDK